MLETVVCPPRRSDGSASESESQSEDYSDDDETDFRGVSRTRRNGEPDHKTHLQIVDLQTVETDNVSSPYSFAFRIDAFSRKVSATDGEFKLLGNGKYLREDEISNVPLEDPLLDSGLTDYLVTLYFQELWPTFPILEKDAVYQLLREKSVQPPNALFTAMFFAAASVSSHRSRSRALSDISSPGLSPKSLSAIPPGLTESLRSTLIKNLASLSTPTLEPRITTLQAILLQCLYDGTLSSDQRTILISDAIRIGQYILLHRSLTSIPSDDNILRKHLWWTTFVLDVWTCSRDQTCPSIHLNEVDIPMPIESEEPDHQAFTALVALTRILHDTLRHVYSPTVNARNIPREVTRLREWVMEWYRNLPSELLVSEDSSSDDAADFLLAGCHAVLLLLYTPFKHEDMVKSEVDRSRGIIRDAIGRLGRKVGAYGIILTAIGDIARKHGN